MLTTLPPLNAHRRPDIDVLSFNSSNGSIQEPRLLPNTKQEAVCNVAFICTASLTEIHYVRHTAKLHAIFDALIPTAPGCQSLALLAHRARHYFTTAYLERLNLPLIFSGSTARRYPTNCLLRRLDTLQGSAESWIRQCNLQ